MAAETNSFKMRFLFRLLFFIFGMRRLRVVVTEPEELQIFTKAEAVVSVAATLTGTGT
jgi:hypothetical protein